MLHEDTEDLGLIDINGYKTSWNTRCNFFSTISDTINSVDKAVVDFDYNSASHTMLFDALKFKLKMAKIS